MKKRISIKLLSVTLAVSSVLSIGLLTAKPTLRADDEIESEITVDALSPAKRVVAIAKKEENYKEKKKNITKYAKYFDNNRKTFKFYNGKKQGTQWCDIFVDWCFAQAFGLKEASSVLYQSKNSCGAAPRYSIQYYKKNGKFNKKPQVGDQIFFGTKKNVSHTGIVVSVNTKRKTVTVIEGNSNNKVEKNTYKMSYSKIVGYGHPNYPSTKLQSFLTNLYSNGINSSLDTKKLYQYSCQLAQGKMTGAYIVKAVFESKSMQNLNLTDEDFINRIPSVLFGRAATEEELQHWLGALETGAATRHEVLKGFVNSSEFVTMCKNNGIKKAGTIA